MTSTIQKTPEAFTNNPPKFARSALVNKGSRLRLDFTDAYTLNGLTSSSSLADGTVFKNLVDGDVDARTVGLSGNVVVGPNNRGLVVATANNNAASYLDFGYGNLDMYEAGNHSFIWHMWMKLDASGALANASLFNSRSGSVGNTDVTSPIFGATPAQMVLGNGSDGFTFNGFSRGGGAVGTVSLAAGALGDGATHLVSFAWNQGANSIYLDGVLAASATASPLTPSFRSHATITAGGNVSAGDTVTINGVAITFVASGASGNQINIGADAATTLTNLRTFINANAASLGARAEISSGQASNVLTVLHNGTQLATAASNPANGDTITINGTAITFVTGTPTGNQVQILGSAILTMQALRTFINANSATLLATATGTGATLGIRGTTRTLSLAASALTLGGANGLLGLTKSAANLTLSSITTPYGYRLIQRSLKGTTFALGMDDLTLAGMTPLQAAAREYALYRARLTALGVA